MVIQLTVCADAGDSIDPALFQLPQRAARRSGSDERSAAVYCVADSRFGQLAPVLPGGMYKAPFLGRYADDRSVYIGDE